MIRTFGWTLAALIGVDQFMMHGTYTSAATDILQHILAHM